MSDNDLPVYCICKTPDIERFMIMCDECEEWFHGDCIKITEKEAKYIKYFYCKACRTKNPLLQIRYRKNKKAEEKEISYKKRMKEKKKLKLKKKKSATGDVHKSASAPVLAESSKSKGKYEKDLPWEPDGESTRRPSLHEKKNSLKIYSSDSDKDVGITMSTPTESKTPAEPLRPDSPKPEVKLLKQTEKKKDESTFQPVLKERPKKEKVKKDSKRCEKCDHCLRKEDCGVCDTCFDKQRYGFAGKMKRCRLRRCLNKKSSKKLKDKAKAATKRKASPAPVEHVEDELPTKHPSKSFYSSLPQCTIPPDVNVEVYGLYKQCLGPGCTNGPDAPSKYCSEACGRRLARSRLHQILPERIQEWNSTLTVANEQGKAELERIRTRMGQARNELTAFEKKFRQLESIIAAGKSLSVDGKRTDIDDDNEGEADHSIYCVVCGHSINIKAAIKHMDKCYIKIESQMSFGSVYPTKIEGSARLFCDVYNEQQQTYCKRLQVLCPEHTKEPKVSENEVCGCPLSCNIYGETTPSKASDFCRLAKRKCNKHFKWETMYRAEVDLQRIRQWLKIDEIFDEERRIRTAMASRAGVVSLLLHQTIVHDPSCVDMRTKPTVSKKPAYKLMI